jgi:hypothetical protein
MIIKCRKGTRTNKLYFSTTFSNDEKNLLQDRSYDMKCHLKITNTILEDYTLHNIDLKNGIGKDLYLRVSYKNNENPEQILNISIDLTSDGHYKSFYILLEGGNTCNPKFRKKACANVEEILQSIFNRHIGIHCDTCIYKHKLNLLRTCVGLYVKNRCKSDLEL